MVVVFGIAAFVLTACSSKKDANEKNFTSAIQQQLDKSSKDLCIPFSSSKDVPLIGWDNQQLQPFESAGLISGTEVEVNSPNFIPNPYAPNDPPPKTKIKRYALTAEGKKFYQETEDKTVPHIVYATQTHFIRGALCYGKVAVDKVVKWSEPSKDGDAQVAQVTYLYKINNLAEWANSPDIQKVSPTIRSMLDGASKTELVQEVIMTNLGWEAKTTH